MDSNNYRLMLHQIAEEFDKGEQKSNDRKVSVSPLVSEVAHMYERFRNAMDYREDEVILRAAIERIVKRHLFFNTSGKNIAASLTRELLWARYLPEIKEDHIDSIAQTIDLYLQLEQQINKKHRISKSLVNEWVMHLLSSEIAYQLNPNREKILICNFMYLVMKDYISISDDTQETKDTQVFIAVHRAFSKDDLPLLRYHLFKQYFNTLSDKNIDKVSDNFPEGLKLINHQLTYPLKDRIYSYIRKRTVPFLILEEIFRKNKGSVKNLILDPEAIKQNVLKTCNEKYESIGKKVQRALIRSVIFLIVTKALFALAIEGTFESVFYGEILWLSIILNTFIPPLLMIIAALFIKTPNKSNSDRILNKINQLIQGSTIVFNNRLDINKNTTQFEPYLYLIFIFLWSITLTFGFGAIILLLTFLEFNPVSQLIFLFFIAIISFLSYRINQMANIYYYGEERQSLKSVLFDFLFMPFIQIGRHLTVGISKINLFLYIFDFFIETPFKGIFGFFEQWFLYLRAQREKLD